MERLNGLGGLVAAFVLLAMSLSMFASADSKADLKGASAKISFADRDVQKRDGASEHFGRLQQANKQVYEIRSLEAPGSAKCKRDARRCNRKTLSTITAEIDDVPVSRSRNSQN